jgi:ketosteroid isomerase-like protein
MSEENVELVRTILSAYEGRDLAAFWRETSAEDMRAIFETVYDPAIEIVWVDTSPDSGPFNGIDEAMGAFAEWLASFDEFFMTATEILDAGDDVVATVVTPGRGRDSGAEVEMTVYWVMTISRGKITRLHEYSAKADALEAVGLSD